MKKLVLGAAIAMSSLTFAQQFGLKAGMNVSSLSKDASMSDTKSKIGFNAGVFMNAPLAESFSIQPELLYSQMGNKSTITTSSTIGANTITTKTTGSTDLDYVTLPVMFQYKATPNFYLEAGPEFGFLVNSKVKSDNEFTEAIGNEIYKKDNMNSFNFGLGLGAGYYFTPNIGITARYVAGFTDVTKENSDVTTNAKNRNNTFQAGLAFKF